MSRKKNEILQSQPHISPHELKLKQSVRTTFKLPEEVINLLGLMADQLGLKQKSLLDQLVEDTGLLEELIEEATSGTATTGARLPKTYVLSKSSLESINHLAKKSNISRDTIIEVSIRRLTPLIETERAKHQKRKKIIFKMKKQLEQGEELRNEALEVLGQEDELFIMLDKQLELARKNFSLSNNLLTKGDQLDSW